MFSGQHATSSRTRWSRSAQPRRPQRYSAVMLARLQSMAADNQTTTFQQDDTGTQNKLRCSHKNHENFAWDPSLCQIAEDNNRGWTSVSKQSCANIVSFWPSYKPCETGAIYIRLRIRYISFPHTHAFGSWLISTLLPVFTKAVYAYMQNFSKLNILIFHVWLDSTSPVFWDAKLFTSIPKSVSIIETTFNNKACLRQIPNLIWTPGTHGTAFLACLDVLVASKLRRLKVVRATFNLNYEAEEIGEEELAQSLAKLWMSKRGILISSFDVPRWLNWGP